MLIIFLIGLVISLLLLETIFFVLKVEVVLYATKKYSFSVLWNVIYIGYYCNDKSMDEHFAFFCFVLTRFGSARDVIEFNAKVIGINYDESVKVLYTVENKMCIGDFGELKKLEKKGKKFHFNEGWWIENE